MQGLRCHLLQINMSPCPLELLVPAKNKEIAFAAISAGADGIFIGGPDLGARSEANNSFDDLKEITSFAHSFNVKVHMTLNTLLYDHELELAQEYIYKANEAKIDAIIFQDPAILTMDIPKGLELHASTQCDIYDEEKLKFYQSLGIKQAVLARELSLEQIKNLHQRVPNIRLEAFVAGALCVAQSGICFISETMTDRSANRGSCAHICRLPMDMYDKENKLIVSGHLLSMKDNYALEQLESLIDCGVSSFKIEGRLKDKEYVVNLCTLFSNRLDNIIARSNGKYIRQSVGKKISNFKADAYKTFNRSLSSNMLLGKKDNLTNISSPKSMGKSIGSVVKCISNAKGCKIYIKAYKDVQLNNADSFIYTSGTITDGFRCNRAYIEDKLYVLEVNKLVNIKNGTILNRTVDTLFIKQINQKGAFSRTLPINIRLEKQANELILTVDDKSIYQPRKRSFSKRYAYIASEYELNQAKIEQTLEKSGFLGIEVNSVEIVLNEPLFVSSSYLNQCRKDLIGSYINSFKRLNEDYQYTLKELDNIKYPTEYIDSRLILNKKALDFYTKVGVDPKKHVPVLIQNSVMTCNNCLVNNHALCKKHGGKTNGYYLIIGNHRFNIVCDCVNCKMHLVVNKNDK